MLLFFVNIAVLSAVLFYLARSFKKTFRNEFDQLLSYLRDPNLPPGPRGLPFLGYIPFLAGKNVYTEFSDLAKQYGGMAFVRLGKKNLFIMRDPDMIREAYKLVAFSHRPKTSFKDENIIGNKGIIQSVGDVWSEHRRVIIAAFRTIGLKSSSSVTPQTSHVAEMMQNDVDEYLKFVSQHVVGRPDGHAMLERLTGRLAGSCISTSVFGLKKSFADEDFSHNVEVIEEGFHVGEMLAPFEFLPILKHIPGWWKRVEEKLKKNYCVTCKYFRGLVKEKTCVLDEEHDIPDSLITIYRNEMAKREASGSNAPAILSEVQLTQTMTDLFCAGTETVKYSMMWVMLYMAKHPEIQSAVQREIDTIHPGDELVSWNDLSRLPFTEAVLLECLRLRPVLPFGHPRAVHDSDTTYRGYEIPKNTVVMSLIWDIHLDPKYWEQPLEFRPNRFLTSEGQTFRPENFLPFGTGRRICIGDQMAMMELFITFTALLKRFTVVPKQGEADLRWKILLSLLIPANFNVDLLPRQTNIS